jgi:hypothetical protein
LQSERDVRGNSTGSEEAHSRLGNMYLCSTLVLSIIILSFITRSRCRRNSHRGSE